MTERKTYVLTDDAVRRLISYARASGSIASRLAADELVPMAERTYTRGNMASAYREGREAGYKDAQGYHAFGDGCGPDWYDCTCPNPHEQEEA